MDGFENSLQEVFIFETITFIEEIENILLAAESDGGSIKGNVPELFRIMHTIKSSAAMMGFEPMSKMAHAAEDLMANVRENALSPEDNDTLVGMIFACVDFMKRTLEKPDTEDTDGLTEQIQDFLQQLSGAKDETAEPMRLHVRFAPNCQMIDIRAFELKKRLAAVCKEITAAPEEGEADYEKRLQENGLLLTLETDQTQDKIQAIAEKSAIFLSKIAFVKNAPEEAAETPVEAEAEVQEIPVQRQGLRKEAIIPIPVARLDEIVELAGELVISDMRLQHALANNDAAQLADASAMLSKQILRMHQTTLSVHMVPLRNAFHKLRLLERDISKKLDKELTFEISGESTEVDKTVVDAAMPALIHLLRNAIDHGIEKPDTREEAGKPRAGLVRLSAVANARYVIITLSDDGRGLNRERIARKAIESGLYTPEELAELSPDEIDNLVFKQGFSTKEKVTEVSGRGVGLDVVLDTVKSLLGSVSLSSEPGKGSTFTLRFPLTLSSMDALIIRTGDEQAILPLGDVNVFFHPEAEDIAMVNGYPSVLYKGSCYKIKTLAEFFGNPRPESYEDGVMVLLKSEPEPYVLYVDDITDHRNVVVKPVPGLLAGMKGVAGCSVLGDGSICLIFDVRSFYGR